MLIPLLPVLACLAAQEAPWEELFDGQTLAGWVGYGGAEAPAGWVVADGCLYRADGGGDIQTTASFDHFELELQWKISPQGNSGIMYRVKENDGAPYFSGPEYQVLDDAGHGLGDDALTAAGALYDLVAAQGKELRPVGEFNDARIVLQGDHLEHWLNGKKVVEIELHGERWNALVAASKFQQWPQFGRSPRGPIVLQDHGNPVWYRHVRIRPLPPPLTEEQCHAEITPGSAHALLAAADAGRELVVLDVRTPAEFAAGHLPHARLIDFNAPDFKERVADLDRDATYLVYCRTGRRSAAALGILQELEFREAYNMLGGFLQWSAQKRPAELPDAE